MASIVTGSGIDRILSMNEVQEDRIARLNSLRAAEARDRRMEIRDTALRRYSETEVAAPDASAADGAGDLPRAAAFRDERTSEGPARRPYFADVVGDAETVNQMLEDAQGVERRISRAESMRLAAVLAEKLLRTHFISMTDPGRAMTTISPRDVARPLDEEG